MSEPVTIYVTKDAATRGIVVKKADIGRVASLPGYAIVRGERSGPWLAPASYRMTLPEAIADAERRRARKIASLETQIAKVRGMDLTKPVGDSLSTTKG